MFSSVNYDIILASFAPFGQLFGFIEKDFKVDPYILFIYFYFYFWVQIPFLVQHNKFNSTFSTALKSNII